MQELFDYYFYSESYLKIKTKLHGLQPLILKDYQRQFIEFLQNIEGPKRVIVLKPRQAGFSTLIASFFAHKMFTDTYFTGIAMADKFARTQAISEIYSTFLHKLPPLLKPMITTDNMDQIILDNPQRNKRRISPGLSSGITFETAQDPNAGRSASRKFAHLSEVAFYRYAKEIDDGVQNSIPLSDETFIIKESTANGRSGDGKSFYDLWNASKRGESIYKSFFVAWFEVDDYYIKPPYDFKMTEEEKILVKENPKILPGNLVWRRLKLLEFQKDEGVGAESILDPKERFKQDYPSNDVEAFLSTGSPCFDQQVLERKINQLTKMPPQNIKSHLSFSGSFIQMFFDKLKVYVPPRQGKTYYMGIDVSEGLAIGDNSSITVVDEQFIQQASWVGKIDPDMLAHLAIDLAIFYNNALIVPEVNNMGHTTLTTLINQGYPKIYREIFEDKEDQNESIKFGWRTTAKSKTNMLNHLLKLFRDEDLKINDVSYLIEMTQVVRGENGIVNLNGKDRVVSLCLAIMGRLQTRIESVSDQPNLLRKSVYGTGKEIMEALNKQPKEDLYD